MTDGGFAKGAPDAIARFVQAKGARCRREMTQVVERTASEGRDALAVWRKSDQGRRRARGHLKPAMEAAL